MRQASIKHLKRPVEKNNLCLMILLTYLFFFILLDSLITAWLVLSGSGGLARLEPPRAVRRSSASFRTNASTAAAQPRVYDSLSSPICILRSSLRAQVHLSARPRSG